MAVVCLWCVAQQSECHEAALTHAHTAASKPQLPHPRLHAVLECCNSLPLCMLAVSVWLWSVPQHGQQVPRAKDDRPMMTAATQDAMAR